MSKIFLKVDFAGCDNISPKFRGCAASGVELMIEQLVTDRLALKPHSLLSQND